MEKFPTQKVNQISLRNFLPKFYFWHSQVFLDSRGKNDQNAFESKFHQNCTRSVTNYAKYGAQVKQVQKITGTLKYGILQFHFHKP